MKIVVQRVSQARVSVEKKVVGQIAQGLCLLVCFEKYDRDQKDKILKRASDKILALRVFEDHLGKMNLSLKEIKGSILAISQFTLAWDGEKGNRPSFDQSLEPSLAAIYFDEFCELLNNEVPLEKGIFGAAMEVEIYNQGPVTFSLKFS